MKLLIYLLLGLCLVGVVSALPYNLSYYFDCENTASGGVFSSVDDVLFNYSINSIFYDVLQVDGVYGSGCFFGQDAGVYNGAQNLGVSDVFSECAYINMTNSSATTDVMVIYDGGEEVQLKVWGDELILDTLSNSWNISAPFAFDGEYHFVCFAVDGLNNVASLYLDGVSVATLSDVSIVPLSVGNTGTYFGWDYAPSNYPYSIDEMMVFSKYLDSSDVADLYNKRWDGASFVSLYLAPAPVVVEGAGGSVPTPEGSILNQELTGSAVSESSSNVFVQLWDWIIGWFK